MAILRILQFPHRVLKKVALPVEIVTDEIRTLLRDMTDTMYDAPGIGLAAPQIGVSLRVIVVDVDWRDKDRNPRSYINPEIVEAFGKISFEEGCLSVPKFGAEVNRSARVVLRALDQDGKPVEEEAEGLRAVCFQHEVDHLNGRLFIDRLSALKRGLYVKRRKKELARKR